jgi:hypothetical protein
MNRAVMCVTLTAFPNAISVGCNVAAPTLGMTGNLPHTFVYEIYALQHYNCCDAA